MWTYNQTDELYHFGIPGMKWGVRRNRLNSSNKNQKNKNNKNSKNNKNNKLSTKQKVALGIATVTTIAATGYLFKKGINKINNENRKLGEKYANKIWKRTVQNANISDNMLISKYSVKEQFNREKKYMPSYNKKAMENRMNLYKKGEENYRKAYNKINEANIVNKIKNIYDYKKNKTVRGIKVDSIILNK